MFKKPLYLFSKEPMTGFYRKGYCDVGEEDGGNHSIAGILPSPYSPFPIPSFPFLPVISGFGGDWRGRGRVLVYRGGVDL